MALENWKAAYANKTSSTIPVYDEIYPQNGYADNVTVSGNQIGSIGKNEFYTLIANEYPHQHRTCFEIRFRNASGQTTRGYIETQPDGLTWPLASWVSGQEPYHYYNSNGSALVASATQTIFGKSCRIFTVKKSVRVRLPDGSDGGLLPVGTQLATNSSDTGATYFGHMLFLFKKEPGGSWQHMDPVQLTSGFVDLGIAIGTSPSARAIW